MSIFSFVREECCGGYPLFYLYNIQSQFCYQHSSLLSLSPVASDMSGRGMLLKPASHLLSGNESSVG